MLRTEVVADAGLDGRPRPVQQRVSWLRTQLVAAQRITLVIGYMAAFVEDETRTPAAMSHIRNTTIDAAIRPFAQPDRPAGLPYDFQWHGPMGYNDGGIRVIGRDRRYPACSTTSAVTASASCPLRTEDARWRGSSPARCSRRASSTRAERPVGRAPGRYAGVPAAGAASLPFGQ